MKLETSRIKLMKIWEILSQETDEDHPMSTNELLEKLNELGIICTRKTLYNDIDTLNEFGYEIFQSVLGSYGYYVLVTRYRGCCLLIFKLIIRFF